MKKFLEKNFVIIVLVIALLTFFKGCGDGREPNNETEKCDRYAVIFTHF